MNPCIFSQNGQHPFRYDKCRECLGYTEGCNNYLGEYKYSKPITRRDLNSGGELELTTASKTSVSKSCESYTPLTNPVLRKNDAVSRIDGESYSRVVLLQNVRSISEPFLPRPNFLERFYRGQR